MMAAGLVWGVGLEDLVALGAPILGHPQLARRCRRAPKWLAMIHAPDGDLTISLGDVQAGVEREAFVALKTDVDG